MYINISLPGGSGWIIDVDLLGNSSTASGRSAPEDGRDELYSSAVGTSFFLCPLFFTPFFIPSSVSLSYFILAVHMR